MIEFQRPEESNTKRAASDISLMGGGALDIWNRNAAGKELSPTLVVTNGQFDEAGREMNAALEKQERERLEQFFAKHPEGQRINYLLHGLEVFHKFVSNELNGRSGFAVERKRDSLAGPWGNRNKQEWLEEYGLGEVKLEPISRSVHQPTDEEGRKDLVYTQHVLGLLSKDMEGLKAVAGQWCLRPDILPGSSVKLPDDRNGRMLGASIDKRSNVNVWDVATQVTVTLPFEQIAELNPAPTETDVQS